MIIYSDPQEKEAALLLAQVLNDSLAISIIERGRVDSRTEAIHLSQFFWRMVKLSATRTVKLPFEGSTEFWTDRLYSSFGGYLDRAGYDDEWNSEIDKA